MRPQQCCLRMFKRLIVNPAAGRIARQVESARDLTSNPTVGCVGHLDPQHGWQVCIIWVARFL